MPVSSRPSPLIATGIPNQYRAGVLTVGNPSAANGNVYNRAVIEDALKEFHTRFCPGYCLGEIGPSTALTVDMSRTSHRVIEATLIGDLLAVTIETLPTPNGMILKKLLDANTMVYVLARGEEIVGADQVVETCRIVTFDVDTMQNYPWDSTADKLAADKPVGKKSDVDIAATSDDQAPCRILRTYLWSLGMGRLRADRALAYKNEFRDSLMESRKAEADLYRRFGIHIEDIFTIHEGVGTQVHIHDLRVD